MHNEVMINIEDIDAVSKWKHLEKNCRKVKGHRNVLYTPNMWMQVIEIIKLNKIENITLSLTHTHTHTHTCTYARIHTSKAGHLLPLI